MWAPFSNRDLNEDPFAFVCFVTAASRFEKYSSLKSHCSSITPLLTRLAITGYIDCRLLGYAVYVFLNLCLVETLMLHIQVHSLSHVSLAYIYACCSRF